MALIELKTAIDFGVSRSKVNVTVIRRVKSVSAQKLKYSLTQSLQTSEGDGPY